MKTRFHHLKVDEGHMTIGEETTWPDSVKISIPHHVVLSMLAKLTSSLQVEEEQGVQIVLTGKLHCDIESS